MGENSFIPHLHVDRVTLTTAGV